MSHAIQEYIKADPFEELSLELLTDTLEECRTWKDNYGRVPMVSAGIAQEIALHLEADTAMRKEYANKNVDFIAESTISEAAIHDAYTPLYFPDSLADFQADLPKRLFASFIKTLREYNTQPTPQHAGTVSELTTALIVSGMRDDGLFMWPSFYRQNDNLMHVVYPQGRKLWDFNLESSGKVVERGTYLTQIKIAKHNSKLNRYHPPIFSLYLTRLIGASTAKGEAQRVNSTIDALKPIVHRNETTGNLKVEPTETMRSYILELLDNTEPLNDSLVFLGAA